LPTEHRTEGGESRVSMLVATLIGACARICHRSRRRVHQRLNHEFWQQARSHDDTREGNGHMGKGLSAVMVAVLLTGCAGHVVKPDDNWTGADDDRAGATAVNLVYAPGAGIKCAAAGFLSFLGLVLTFGEAYEEVSRIMHSNCNAEEFTMSSKDIRQAVP
jgi:hypothetical protein